ncbi:transposase [Micromonospora sp. NPDC051006]|uniref:transposase n=1 Tax=Micromonospora sp. NPDC051006 TaxID=3364283 RepID=UPI00379F9946
MQRFPTAGHLVSWARFAPGVKESAGTTTGKNATGHGNSYLARVLGTAAGGPCGCRPPTTAIPGNTDIPAASRAQAVPGWSCTGTRRWTRGGLTQQTAPRRPCAIRRMGFAQGPRQGRNWHVRNGNHRGGGRHRCAGRWPGQRHPGGAARRVHAPGADPPAGL